MDGGERGRLQGEAHTQHTGITAGVGGEKRESSARDAAAAAAQRASERARERESERGREREGERGRAGKFLAIRAAVWYDGFEPSGTDRVPRIKRKSLNLRKKETAYESHNQDPL